MKVSQFSEGSFPIGAGGLFLVLCFSLSLARVWIWKGWLVMDQVAVGLTSCAGLLLLFALWLGCFFPKILTRKVFLVWWYTGLGLLAMSMGLAIFFPKETIT